VDTWDKVRDADSGAFPLHAFRTQVARQDCQDAGWDPLLWALEQGKGRHLQHFDFGVGFRKLSERFLFTCASASRLAASLSDMPKLLYLSLFGSKIGSGGGVALARGLQHTPHRRYLALFDNKIGDEGIQAIAGVFHKISKLEVLGHARRGGKSACVLFEVFATTYGFRCHDTLKPAANLIFKRLTDLPNLKKLEWCGRLDVSQVLFLGAQLQCLPKLASLHLRGLDHAGAGCLEALAAVIVDLPALEHLTINDYPLLLTAQMCSDFKNALAACGFREEEKFPGQMDTQRKSEERALRRMGYLGQASGMTMTRTLDLRRKLS